MIDRVPTWFQVRLGRCYNESGVKPLRVSRHWKQTDREIMLSWPDVCTEMPANTHNHSPTSTCCRSPPLFPSVCMSRSHLLLFLSLIFPCEYCFICVVWVTCSCPERHQSVKPFQGDDGKFPLGVPRAENSRSLLCACVRMCFSTTSVCACVPLS